MLMSLQKLAEFANRAVENAKEYGANPDEVPVSIQIDCTESESLWADDVELTYDGDGQASGCVLHGWAKNND